MCWHRQRSVNDSKTKPKLILPWDKEVSKPCPPGHVTVTERSMPAGPKVSELSRTGFCGCCWGVGGCARRPHPSCSPAAVAAQTFERSSWLSSQRSLTEQPAFPPPYSIVQMHETAMKTCVVCFLFLRLTVCLSNKKKKTPLFYLILVLATRQQMTGLWERKLQRNNEWTKSSFLMMSTGTGF